MQKFEILLKNDKLKFYYRLNLYFVISSTLLFFYIAFFIQNNLTEKQTFIYCGIAFIFMVAVAFDPWKKRDLIYGGAYLYLAFAWTRLGLYWPALLIIILAVLFFLSIKKKQLIINKDKIIYPSIPGKSFQWSEINNVILKDGMLTIDLKNNRLIQQLIDEELTPVNEKEFNEFCWQQFNIQRGSY